MDIIAAHQQGLIEQLEEEVRALSGAPRDHCQRAVVLHHLFDHSRGAHHWALVEAAREVGIARSLSVLRNWLDRWAWILPGREAAKSALAELSEAIGEESRQRCASAYRAYRLTAVPALEGEAERSLPAELCATLMECHASRRSGEELPPLQVERLWTEAEKAATAAADPSRLDEAWVAVAATPIGRKARRLLGQRAIDRRIARARKSCAGKLERKLRSEHMLPAAFRANPAQHFYALQQLLAERRRQRWREACDREPGAFELAA